MDTSQLLISMGSPDTAGCILVWLTLEKPLSGRQDRAMDSAKQPGGALHVFFFP
jgi:hypothetical protein